MILVTGGADFIGSNVVAALSERQHAVAVCDCLGRAGKWRNLAKSELSDVHACRGRRAPLRRTLPVAAGPLPVTAMGTRIRHVILDRDGVLNVEHQDASPISDWSQWRWIEGALGGLSALSHAGVHVSVATNQSGLGRGTLIRGEINYIHANMVEQAGQAGATIERVLVCPHTPEDYCTCRKPLPGLLLQAVRASGVPRDATVAVGDDLRDLRSAWAAHVLAVLVRTGKGRSTEAMLPQGSVAVFDDLCAFADAVLGNALSEVANTP